MVPHAGRSRSHHFFCYFCHSEALLTPLWLIYFIFSCPPTRWWELKKFYDHLNSGTEQLRWDLDRYRPSNIQSTLLLLVEGSISFATGQSSLTTTQILSVGDDSEQRHRTKMDLTAENTQIEILVDLAAGQGVYSVMVHGDGSDEVQSVIAIHSECEHEKSPTRRGETTRPQSPELDRSNNARRFSRRRRSGAATPESPPDYSALTVSPKCDPCFPLPSPQNSRKTGRKSLLMKNGRKPSSRKVIQTRSAAPPSSKKACRNWNVWSTT